MEFTPRQKQIIDIVKINQPITSGQLAKKLNMTRAAIRPDLTILTMMGFLDAKPKVGYSFSGKSMNNIAAGYIKNIKVGVIKSEAVMISESTTVYDAIVTLFLKDVGTIYIHENGMLIGVVSRKDCLKVAIGNTDTHKIPVGVIMTRMPNITYIMDEDSACDAASKIIQHEVDSIPVVKEVNLCNEKVGYEITGKVSKTNITKLIYNFCNNDQGGM